MELGKKIKTLRVKRGITQEALANALGVTAQTISKWENEITMPDISLLPEIAIFFGISIDSLFSLTPKHQMERISNRMEEAALLQESEVMQMEDTLTEIAKEREYQAEALRLKADIHNHQAEVHRRIAGEYAKEAMYLDEGSQASLSAFCNARGSYMPDWNVRNHHALIEELYEFTKAFPKNRGASMWLLDNLMADGRLSEAELELEHLMQVDNTFRVVLYKELLAQAKGEKELAKQYNKELEEGYEQDWLVQLTLGDLATCHADYEKAIAHYWKSLELQPAPKYMDAPNSVAHIYEILGKKQEAIRAYQEVLKVLKDDWGMIAGEDVESANRSIQKLIEQQENK